MKYVCMKKKVIQLLIVSQCTVALGFWYAIFKITFLWTLNTHFSDNIEQHNQTKLLSQKRHRPFVSCFGKLSSFGSIFKLRRTVLLCMLLWWIQEFRIMWWITWKNWKVRKLKKTWSFYFRRKSWPDRGRYSTVELGVLK